MLFIVVLSWMTCELKHLKKFLFLETNLIRSGDPSKGEVGDYVTESENRHLKSHLSPGVPSLKNWQEAARNHNIRTKNLEMLFKRLSITDPSSQDSSTFLFDNDILMERSLICQSTLSSPQLEKDIMTLDGQGIIQKKSAFSGQMLPCLIIFFWNYFDLKMPKMVFK